ncbi:glycogen/starch/alpha-glucan phosphorylase [Frigidibacter sp. ROC022]|uniref:glycogen/starch/alpha-glucan phosphorylase n=1 Tax=Frigidibacter sp. ROC022 TaxID=2971796 RepID=UPI00215A374B|nr:glycogen/starch/alpha-glucan phosphorylase [Frigidibacter sp. ROC022]MCR8725683.1 glycogen/starch/alpha-glucan phosphorylase [Frigidibacter sp. ROC022]
MTEQPSAPALPSLQTALDAGALRSDTLREDILRHLRYSLGKDPAHASVYDWRMALSFALRDRIVGPWFAATKRTYASGAKRVYYLSMEFLIGRILEDAAINLGLHEACRVAVADLGQDWAALVEDEPDAALGNGGLGRLAACFMDSMATLGVPAHGYGIRYEHGLFRQRFEGGQQVETPEDWLSQKHPWEFERPEVAYEIGFKGHVTYDGDRARWHPGESVLATGHDMPVIGWKGRWANTLRLWAAAPTTLFDLERFNRGDYAAAAEPEALARTISRVLYPDDTTYQGKELRLKQEYFLTSAALQDILRRFGNSGQDPLSLGRHVAVQLNDTHPAIAGPELIRLLVDDHGVGFEEAAETAVSVLGFTNHTLMPEALERWATYLMGNTLPRHMQIIERIDDWHARSHPKRPANTAIVRDDQVHMGELAFIMAHRVNGVSALHSDLVASSLFPDLAALHPGRIVNETNGITPRRWLKLANPGLAGLADEAGAAGWEADLDRLRRLEPLAEDAGFREKFRAVKQANKARLADWLGGGLNPAAMFDIQVKRIHEYKRQLMNVLETIALWQAIRDDPGGAWAPRVKIFGGKAAPGYAVAKEIVRLINDVGAVLNADEVTRDLLRVVYPPNYNVSMAERLIPAADLSEQISTAGTEASGTGNMKFALNGALTIGTLDGANVEIREQVGAENFFLFGLTTEEATATRATPDHSRAAIEASPILQRVLQTIAEGRFSHEEPGRYRGLVDRLWTNDHFLVASDFDAYWQAQRRVDAAWHDPASWNRMAVLNAARMGYFSSDRTISGYMSDIWDVSSLL